ncbi:MAG: hypothetical protein JSS34_08355 [Proteobacteria bacterium]|nr:hypothetical protein [Pseudomonadota bacterium]
MESAFSTKENRMILVVNKRENKMLVPEKIRTIDDGIIGELGTEGPVGYGSKMEYSKKEIRKQILERQIINLQVPSYITQYIMEILALYEGKRSIIEYREVTDP